MTPEQQKTARKERKLANNKGYYAITFTDKHGPHVINMWEDNAKLVTLDTKGNQTSPAKPIQTAIEDAGLPEVDKHYAPDVTTSPSGTASAIPLQVPPAASTRVPLIWSPANAVDHAHPSITLTQQQAGVKGPTKRTVTKL